MSADVGCIAPAAADGGASADPMALHARHVHPLGLHTRDRPAACQRCQPAPCLAHRPAARSACAAREQQRQPLGVLEAQLAAAAALARLRRRRQLLQLAPAAQLRAQLHELELAALGAAPRRRLAPRRLGRRHARARLLAAPLRRPPAELALQPQRRPLLLLQPTLRLDLLELRRALGLGQRRLKLSLVVHGGEDIQACPWSAAAELDAYVLKAAYVSPACRLSPEEERLRCTASLWADVLGMR